MKISDILRDEGIQYIWRTHIAINMQMKHEEVNSNTLSVYRVSQKRSPI
jgi:hypothetical protein